MPGRGEGPINGGQVHSLVLEGKYDLTQLTSLQFTLYIEHITVDSGHCTLTTLQGTVDTVQYVAAPTIVVSRRVLST